MCGIWFSLGYPPDPAHLDMVAHRGPDGRGWQVFDTPAGPAAMGHRRLSIIDLSDAAAQPMSYADGRYWITYNGEIYNYLELREQLAAAGHVFRTRSDTEVLLAAYAEWGEEALDRLVGMFAFALFDAGAQVVFAARDRFAIKPLYYAASSQGVAFASEIKQLVALPGFTPRLNIARAYDFLTSGIMDHTGETMFDGVGQLEGGECVRLDLHGNSAPPVETRRWYRIIEPGTIELGEHEAGQRFRELLTDSVRLHLRSDVPVGSCLSGGLDSSSIVCLMRREFEKNGAGGEVHSVSACYDIKAVDERPFMEAVVEHAHSLPHWCYPRFEDAFAEAERITWHQDEPYGSTSIFAQSCVFAEAAQAGLKVMLDGQGADEQLAGYHALFPFYFANLIRHRRFGALLRAMAERHRWHGVPFCEQARTYLLPLLPSRLAGLLRRGRQMVAPAHNWIDGEAMRPHLGRSAFEFAREHIGRPPIDGIGDVCVVLTQSSSLAMLLHWEDRNSMAHSIEARVPFLDHRLVEFTIGLGDRHKMVGGDTKRVLRRAMEDILPEPVLHRRDKLGFTTPEEDWFRGPLRELVRAGIDQTLARYPALFNRQGVEAHAADMLEGRRPVDFSLWRIISLGIWGRVFGATA